MVISAETMELLVAAAFGVLGKFGYDKGRSLIANGRAGYLTRDSHDRECLLKIKPVMDSLDRVDKHFAVIENKLDSLTAVAGILDAKK